MTQSNQFAVNLGTLKPKAKANLAEAERAADQAAALHGFESREPQKRRGRPASPRTGQVHAKVMPDVADAIGAEAKRRGVTQGVLIEEAWVLYIKQQGK